MTRLRYLLLTAAIVADAAHAYDLPIVNLGLTSFLDGGMPTGSGWYFQQYSSHRLVDKKGDKLDLPKTKLDYQVAVSQLTYLSNLHLKNVSPGLSIVQPIITKMDLNDGLHGAALKAQDGVGDLLIGPFIQFDPLTGADGLQFVQRIELQVNAPTGKYSDKKDVNPDNNAWSVDPYWAATYWFTAKWTVSVRAHYLYNFKNDNPPRGFTGASKIQAGQALHANFATDYAITPQLRLGINGYWLKQITDTKVNGHAVSGRREKIWAIGPGAMYSFSQNNHLVFNAYLEQDAENRPEGSRLQARYIHHF